MTVNFAPLLAMLSLQRLGRLCGEMGDELEDAGPGEECIDDWEDHVDRSDE